MRDSHPDRDELKQGVCDMQNYINYGLNYIDIKLINMYTVTHKRK